MKVKVLKPVLDSKTKKRLEVGVIIELTKSRAESAIKRGLVEKIKVVNPTLRDTNTYIENGSKVK